MSLGSHLKHLRTLHRSKRHYRLFHTLLLGLFAAFMVISIVLFPAQVFNASLGGLNIWWKIVFPTLLPVLILSEFMLGFGILHGLGATLDPLLKRLFRLPSHSGLAIVHSLMAGFPKGAQVTNDQVIKYNMKPSEASRLLAYSHIANPVFIISIIGVGFLGSVRLGFMLAILYYVSHFLTGFLLRQRAKSYIQVDNANENLRFPLAPSPDHTKISYLRAIKQAIKEGRRVHSKAFGKMLGDAVMESIQNLMTLGGYIIIFSVLATQIQMIPLDPLQSRPIWLKLFLEVHLGSLHLVQSSSPLPWVIAWISVGLGWSGIASFLQVKSMIYPSNIQMKQFVIHRVIHALIAFGLTFVLWKPLQLLW